MKFKRNSNSCIAGMYVGPQVSGSNIRRFLDQLEGRNNNRVILAGDLNARHCNWDICKTNNARGKVLVN